MSVRLQKYLAQAGLGSRRGCEDLIRAGRVTIEGRVATLGESVDPETQTVSVDGRPVVRERMEYWLFNKPAGVLSAVVDNRGRRTVTDCVPAQVRVFPVGRLDLHTTGLMLLTNDGQLAARLLHPRYQVEKEYVVKVRGAVAQTSIRRLRSGLLLEDGRTAPAQVSVLERTSEGKRTRDDDGPTNATTTLRVVLREGRKRQVRRMMEAVGHRVITLHRSRFDGLTDAGLALGQARPLSDGEIERLRRHAFAR